MLIKTYPEALRIKLKGPDGWLPLHTCIHFNNTMAVIRVVLEAHPEAAKQVDGLGNLPLHLYCAHNEQDDTGEIAKLLIEAYPEALRTKGFEGWLHSGGFHSA